MCIYSNGKYNFKTTGRTMEKIDIEDLSKEEINELFATPANAMELAYIRKNLHDLRGGIQNISLSVQLALDKLDLHNNSCPINKTKVNEIIDIKLNEFTESETLQSKVKKVINDSIISTGKIATALISIIIFLSGFGMLIFFISKNAK